MVGVSRPAGCAQSGLSPVFLHTISLTVSRLRLNLSLPLLLLLVGLAAVGCRKVENPRRDFSQTKPTGFLFNYEIPQEYRESDLPKVRKIEPITGFNGSVLRVL